MHGLIKALLIHLNLTSGPATPSSLDLTTILGWYSLTATRPNRNGLVEPSCTPRLVGLVNSSRLLARVGTSPFSHDKNTAGWYVIIIRAFFDLARATRRRGGLVEAVSMVWKSMKELRKGCCWMCKSCLTRVDKSVHHIQCVRCLDSKWSCSYILVVHAAN